MIVPVAVRESLIMESLHEAHPGMVRMKSLARSYFWWPNLDAEIENRVRNALCSRLTAGYPLMRHYTHGSGLGRHHIDYIQITLDHLKAK